MNALHVAVDHLDIEAVKQLLAVGADPNLAEPELGGFTPLHLAIDSECEDSCYRYNMGEVNATPKVIVSELLLRAGSDPDIPDQSGLTARKLASMRMHHAALQVFKSKV